MSDSNFLRTELPFPSLSPPELVARAPPLLHLWTKRLPLNPNPSPKPPDLPAEHFLPHLVSHYPTISHILPFCPYLIFFQDIAALCFTGCGETASTAPTGNRPISEVRCVIKPSFRLTGKGCQSSDMGHSLIRPMGYGPLHSFCPIFSPTVCKLHINVVSSVFSFLLVQNSSILFLVERLILQHVLREGFLTKTKSKITIFHRCYSICEGFLTMLKNDTLFSKLNLNSSILFLVERLILQNVLREGFLTKTKSKITIIHRCYSICEGFLTMLKNDSLFSKLNLNSSILFLVERLILQHVLREGFLTKTKSKITIIHRCYSICEGFLTMLKNDSLSSKLNLVRIMASLPSYSILYFVKEKTFSSGLERILLPLQRFSALGQLRIFGCFNVGNKPDYQQFSRTNNARFWLGNLRDCLQVYEHVSHLYQFICFKFVFLYFFRPDLVSVVIRFAL